MFELWLTNHSRFALNIRVIVWNPLCNHIDINLDCHASLGAILFNHASNHSLENEIHVCFHSLECVTVKIQSFDVLLIHHSYFATFPNSMLFALM